MPSAHSPAFNNQDGDDDDVLQTYNVGHTDKLTGVIHTEGAIYTSSSDATVRVLEPSLNPGPITTLQKHSTGVAGVGYVAVGWLG